MLPFESRIVLQVPFSAAITFVGNHQSTLTLDSTTDLGLVSSSADSLFLLLCSLEMDLMQGFPMPRFTNSLYFEISLFSAAYLFVIIYPPVFLQSLLEISLPAHGGNDPTQYSGSGSTRYFSDVDLRCLFSTVMRRSLSMASSHLRSIVD